MSTASRLAIAGRSNYNGQMKRLTRVGIVGVIICVAALVPFYETIHTRFVFDDLHSISDNQALRNVALGELLFRPEAFSSFQVPMFRPLLIVSYALHYRMGFAQPLHFHIVNLGFHLITSLMVFFLSRGIFGNAWLAFWAALIFAVHPVHSETLNYISCRSTLMASCFYILALYGVSHWSAPAPKTSWFWLVLAVSCFALGLLSKSIVVTMPGVAVLVSWMMLRDEGPSPYPTRRVWLLLLGLVAVLGLYFTSRYLLGLTLAYSPDPPRSLITNLLTQTRVLWLYIRLVALPFNLSLAHDVTIIDSVFDARFIFSAAGLSALAAGFVLLRRRAAVLVFSLVWFALLLLPTCFVPLQDPASEHRLYLACLGIIWPLCSLGAWLISKPRLRYITFIAMLLIPVLLGYISCSQNRVWRSEAALWENALHMAPRDTRPHINLGIELNKLGRTDAAEREYNFALKLDPQNSRAHVNLGNVYSERGLYSLAIAEYQLALQSMPGSIKARLNLALLYMDIHDFAKAQDTLLEAQQMAPYDPMVPLLLGKLYMKPGFFKPENASRQFARSLALDPSQADAANIKAIIARLESGVE